MWRTVHTHFLVRMAAAAALVMGAASAGAADASRSAAPAQALATLMAQHKLDAFAVRDPAAPDTFVAAMLFPGVQLLVVAGTPTSPAAGQAEIDQKKYADVYALLHQAVVPDSKVFVQDLKADGLHADAPDSADIVYKQVINQMVFDGEPAKHKLTEAKYAQQFASADAEYTRLLTLLVDGLRAQ